jgi:pilus assembly protein CpaE
VLLGIRDLAFHQEVLDFLVRDPRVHVVGAASEADALVRLIGEETGSALVVCPAVARELRHPTIGSRLPDVLIVAEEMTVPVLREAIDVKARGVYSWPEERDDLTKSLVMAASEHSDEPGIRGMVLAVVGARGGAGTTFIATHLAATFASRGIRSALVDLDGGYADVTVALGVGSDDRTRNIGDLRSVMDELSPDHLEDALYRHSSGFAALLSPEGTSQDDDVPLGLYSGSIQLLAGTNEVVILHVPRSIGPLPRLAVSLADEVLLVTTLDLFSLHGAKRALSALGIREPSRRWRVVVNKLTRGDVTADDVERVLGVTPAAAIRMDPAVHRAQNRGQLLPIRSRRAGRDVRLLARSILADRAAALDAGAAQ